KEEDLLKWQKSYGKDKDSKSHTVAIEKFKIKKKIGANYFTNGAFGSNIKGLDVLDGQGSWSSNKINGGCLQVVTPKSSAVVINLGSLKKDKKYLVKFTGVANKAGAIKVLLRHYGSPW